MKESFDDIIRRRWEERQFPVDQHHRAGMADLLNQNPRRRAFPFWWMAGLVVVLFLAGYILFFKNTTDNGTEHIVPDHQKSITSADRHADPMQTPPLAETEHKQQDLAQKEHHHQSNITVEQKGKNNNESPLTAQDRTFDNQSSSPAKSSETRGVKKTTPPVATKSTESKKSVTAAEISSTPSDQTTQTVPIYPGVISTVPDPFIATEQKFVERAIVEVPSIESLTIDPLNYDLSEQVGPVTRHTPKRNPVYLFGEAGVGMVMASRPDFSSGWKARIGGGLGIGVFKRTELTWSAGYLVQQGGFDFQRTSTVSRPGFGLRSSFHTLTPDRLHYMYSRLGIQYRLQRNVFALHGGIQWLYGAQGDIVIQQQDQFAGNQELSRYAWLKTDGLRRLSGSGAVSYGYRITPRMTASAGTDVYISSFTVSDEVLAEEGYYWKGRYASFHPFITLNYHIYGLR